MAPLGTEYKDILQLCLIQQQKITVFLRGGRDETPSHTPDGPSVGYDTFETTHDLKISSHRRKTEGDGTHPTFNITCNSCNGAHLLTIALLWILCFKYTRHAEYSTLC